MAHWQQPSPPSRGLRLLVFAAVVVVIIVIALATYSLLYTMPVTPVPNSGPVSETPPASGAAAWLLTRLAGGS